MWYTHRASEISLDQLGHKVTLCGWVHKRRVLGGVVFLVLRDSSGFAALVFDRDISIEAARSASQASLESVITVTGVVSVTVDATSEDRSCEIRCETLVVVNPADPLPFRIDVGSKEKVEVRARFRYIDLRRRKNQELLELRSVVMKRMRRTLEDHGFLEIETPILSLPTLGGAREFLVASRQYPGSFFALPQSPQLWKQLLVIGGVERCFQIARCFRDEDLRSNRQPEFSQLDLEMSFCHLPDVERVLKDVCLALADIVGAQKTTFTTVAFDDCVDLYGNCTPDLRLGPEILNLSGLGWMIGVPPDLESIRGLVISKGRGEQLGHQFFASLEQTHPALEWAVLSSEEHRADPQGNSPTHLANARMMATLGLQDSLLLVCGGPKKETAAAMGNTWSQLADDSRSSGEFTFCFVTEQPLFEPTKDGWRSHHQILDAPLEEEDMRGPPAEIRGQAFRLVCNGRELGAGSIRIHSYQLLLSALRIIGISTEDAGRHFGPILKAMRYGAPPHGGSSLSVEASLLALSDHGSIRDILPFPKASSGRDLLTGAPLHL